MKQVARRFNFRQHIGALSVGIQAFDDTRMTKRIGSAETRVVITFSDKGACEVPIIKITPEGYTPDGKYRLVPVDIKSEIHSVYHHAMGQGLREQDKRGVLAFHKSVIETAPPPPAEMLEEAKKKVLMPADMLAKARRALAHAASGNSMYQQDYDDFCAAIDAARGK